DAATGSGSGQPGAGAGADPDSAALGARLRSLQIRLFVGLDLSAGSDVLGVSNPVDPYRASLPAPPIAGRLLGLATAYETAALSGRRMLFNGLRADASRGHLGGLHLTLPLDAAAIALTGCPSLAFCTVNDSRAAFDTPADRPERVDLARLERQVDLLRHVIPRLVDDPELEPWEWGNDVFGVIRGQVLHFGPRSYLAEEPTAGALVRVRLRHPTLTGVRPDFWTVADDSGRFRIPGVETETIYTQPVRLEAYGVDPRTGAVTDAPDWGINGERRLPSRRLTVQMDDQEKQAEVVTAPLRGLTLVQTFDPRHLLTPEQLQVVDAATQAEPPVFGGCLPLTTPEVEVFGYENRVGSYVEPTAVVFAPAGARVQVVMATGRFGLGRRLVLLNGSDAAPAGTGYPVDQEACVPQTARRVAGDLARLNGQRLAELERHGVRNARLRAFHRRSEERLDQADEARAQGDPRAFLDRARQSWAYAAAAYRDVQQTRAGVVQGALFLLAALLPFAHFAERLLCGFADVRRQVLGYFAFFLAGFAALSYLHPAFELAISPAVVLLGFVILSLGILVTAIGVSRLNREVQALVAGRRGHGQVRRTGAVLASVALGLAHLRRRPLRTGLTCATLVLLTFSVLSFTSIRSTLRANWIEVEGRAAYTGALVRLPGWQSMEMSAYAMLRDRFGPERTAPRAWMAVPSLAHAFRAEREGDGGATVRAATVQGIAGLTVQEARLVRPQDGVLAGRWLEDGEEDACLLPAGVADSLGLGVADVGQAWVRLFGERFRVVGVLDPQALERRDLNGEPLTPLDPEAQKPAESEVGADARGRTPVFAHLPGATTAVLPFAAVMRWERARLASVAVDLGGIGDGTPQEHLERLSEVLDLDLFAGLGGRRFLVNTVGVASVAGLGSLVVPLTIAGLIVLNTMLGAVYERTREIGTLNAVGLAPAHVSGLFVAEAVAFGVVGAVLGYLLGQTAAQVGARLGWLQGIELNYSSLAAVFTLGLVIALVVASSLYPARMAGRICTPGIERRWRPPEPEGHRLRMRLPFSLARREAAGMAAFQAEFWGMHREQTLGAGFYVEDLRVRRQGEQLRVEARVWLAPFDQGVVQQVALELAPGSEARYWDIDVELVLVAGDFETWRRVSRTFLDDLRKQFLLWRTLPEADRRAYAAELGRWQESGTQAQTGAQP
ncbi:MAG: ABC transporter permease, partial [Candidatus Latescibacterota bacterium]